MSNTSTPLTIWLLSPYHTGSHRSWAEGYARHSQHRIEIVGMAGRFWKWRMQGGSIELAEVCRQKLEGEGAPDLVLATDMVNLPQWLALLRDRLPGDLVCALYMHENQLTYPWPSGERKDLSYAVINWMSQLCANVAIFNSEFHRQSWFEELPRLLKNFPDYNHLSLIKPVKAHSEVLPVGVNFEEQIGQQSSATAGSEPPLILWNQRWEYDKRPDRFFDLLYELERRGIDFQLAVAGENFRRIPTEFEEARARLGDRIVQWGYVERRDEYRALLSRADLVISTADHEFFGISVVEAIGAGAFPILPNRLSYPELIPTELHPACLYSSREELVEMTTERLRSPRRAPPSLQNYVREQFHWKRVAMRYDTLFSRLLTRPS